MSEMIERVARADAVAHGLPRYFTGLPCANGHIAQRNTKNRECISCALERSARDPNKAERTRRSSQANRGARAIAEKARYWKDVASSRSYQRDYRNENIERVREKEASQREKHRERKNEYARDRYQNDRDAVREASRKWAQNNKASVAARTARRRARKLQATPEWVDHRAIASFYEKARQISIETGIPHEVDHIHPLQGENFCGLHVPWNLQILTKSENSRKKNRLLDAALSEERQ